MEQQALFSNEKESTVCVEFVPKILHGGCYLIRNKSKEKAFMPQMREFK